MTAETRHWDGKDLVAIHRHSDPAEELSLKVLCYEGEHRLAFTIRDGRRAMWVSLTPETVKMVVGMIETGLRQIADMDAEDVGPAPHAHARPCDCGEDHS